MVADLQARIEGLGRDWSVAEGRDRVAISAELRQLEAAWAVECERVAAVERDSALGEGEDPGEVASVLTALL
jgi:hypothetical protein